LKKVLLLAGILFLLLSELIQAQEDPGRYLDSIERKYSGVKDYLADVNVHFDIEALKAPDMQAKLYYKAPDKMKVESKRIFFFPKEGGYFNPSLFKKKDFDVRFLERLIYDGRKAVRLKLTPTDTEAYNKVFVLTIDTERNLIREIKISPSEGREIKAVVEYGMFNHFELPTHIDLQLDIPSDEPSGMKEFTQFGQKTKRITGKVEITYSNYKVNVGLTDEIFKDTEPHRLK
jgi:outer membrane lipoprotein-sorting protein